VSADAFRKLIAGCALAAVVAAFCAVGVALVALNASTTASSRAATAARAAALVSTGIRELLLNGKTASAISARKTAGIVKGIQEELTFDHQSTVRGQQTVAEAERQLERHLDQTIRLALSRTASKRSR
jgi:hypothetical protein